MLGPSTNYNIGATIQLFWGIDGFPVNQAACRLNTFPVDYENIRNARKRIRIMVKATLDGIGQTALSLAEALCRTALSRDYRDLILVQDNGFASSVRLINIASLTGVHIVDGPHFNEFMNGEFVNCRTVEFAAEAEFINAGYETAILSWQESMTVNGNGQPQIVWRFPVNATAIPQVVSPTSLITTVQAGRAVGHTAYPVVPVPIFGKKPKGGVFRGDRSSVKKDSPRAYGRGYIEYPISWNYVWESILPLDANPNRPPLG